MKTLGKVVAEAPKPARKSETESETGAYFLRLKPYPAQIVKMPSYFADRVEIKTEVWSTDCGEPLLGVWLRVNQDLIDRLNNKLGRSTVDVEQRGRIQQLLRDLKSTSKFPGIIWSS